MDVTTLHVSVVIISVLSVYLHGVINTIAVPKEIFEGQMKEWLSAHTKDSMNQFDSRDHNFQGNITVLLAFLFSVS